MQHVDTGCIKTRGEDGRTAWIPPLLSRLDNIGLTAGSGAASVGAERLLSNLYIERTVAVRRPSSVCLFICLFLFDISHSIHDVDDWLWTVRDVGTYRCVYVCTCV